MHYQNKVELPLSKAIRNNEATLIWQFLIGNSQKWLSHLIKNHIRLGAECLVYYCRMHIVKYVALFSLKRPE